MKLKLVYFSVIVGSVRSPELGVESWRRQAASTEPLEALICILSYGSFGAMSRPVQSVSSTSVPVGDSTEVP